MTATWITGRGLWAACLCLALMLWSLAPALSHAPAVFETIQDHVQTIAEHGHSHGFEEDLARVMHGHGHDSADHDHSPALLIAGRMVQPFPGYWELARPSMTASGSWPVHRIERPPRV